ncbi:MAG: SurA N-terminal domain-containing protein [Hyphomicrobiaceae bacterium]|nr:SurA N-terminal domain-containing protein [Hyphomicrobiaceae bacterium]
MPIRNTHVTNRPGCAHWGRAGLMVPLGLAFAVLATTSVFAQAPAPAGLTKAAANSRSEGGAAARPKSPARSTGIAILVNDEPITNFEIDQRQRLLGLSASDIQEKAKSSFQNLVKAESTSEKLKAILKKTIDENRGKSREDILAIFEKRKMAFAQTLREQAVASARAAVLPGLRKQAIDELIEERLKLQEAKRLNVLAGDDEIKKVIEGMAERNKMNEAQFGEHMKKLGADIGTMRTRFRASLSWTNVIRRQFGHQISISDRDLDRAVAGISAEDQTELDVQRITLAVSTDLGQQEIAKRLAEASDLRGRFTSCKETSTLARTVGGARFEVLGPTAASRIAEPTRTMLLNAKDGEMLPASVGGTGVELWVLCGRKAIAAADAKRDEAAKELRQREFEVLAKRHLKDLREDAHIEYR